MCNVPVSEYAAASLLVLNACFLKCECYGLYKESVVGLAFRLKEESVLVR